MAVVGVSPQLMSPSNHGTNNSTHQQAVARLTEQHNAAVRDLRQQLHAAEASNEDLRTAVAEARAAADAATAAAEAAAAVAASAAADAQPMGALVPHRVDRTGFSDALVAADVTQAVDDAVLELRKELASTQVLRVYLVCSCAAVAVHGCTDAFPSRSANLWIRKLRVQSQKNCMLSCGTRRCVCTRNGGAGWCARTRPSLCVVCVHRAFCGKNWKPPNRRCSGSDSNCAWHKPLYLPPKPRMSASQPHLRTAKTQSNKAVKRIGSCGSLCSAPKLTWRLSRANSGTEMRK